jgi:pyruvate kinase
MNVVRLNTAHQTPQDTLRIVHNVRRVSDKIGIILDTKGPEIRTANIDSTLKVVRGQIISLASSESIHADIHVNYENFINEIPEGKKILIDDGSVELLIKEKKEGLLLCEVLNEGQIGNKKSVNVPDCHFNLSAVSDKDKQYIEFAVENDIDFIAHSFVRNKEDIKEIQNILDAKGGKNKIIAKIENQEGVDNIDEILDVAYGIMVARGDLGIEIAAQDVPLAQKKMITKCMERAKPVIIATQLLHSMIDNPRPTRAEVSDIANAIYDGTDALMLSGETTHGKYPVESVKMMTDIAISVERDKNYKEYLPTFTEKDLSRNFLVKTAVRASKELPVKAIIIDSQTGRSALLVAAYRGEMPVYAMVHDKRLVRELSLSYGIYPSYMELPETTDELVCTAVTSLLNKQRFREEDTILILAGTPGQNAGANFLEINEAGLCLKSKECASS